MQGHFHAFKVPLITQNTITYNPACSCNFKFIGNKIACMLTMCTRCISMNVTDFVKVAIPF